MSRCDACGQGRVENTGPTTPPRCDVCGYCPIPLVGGGQGRSGDEVHDLASALGTAFSWVVVAAWLSFLVWVLVNSFHLVEGSAR